MRFTGEICKPHTDLVQRNLWRAPPIETTLMESSLPQGPAARSSELSATVRNKHRRTHWPTGPSTSEGQAPTQLRKPPSLLPHELQRQSLASPVGRLPTVMSCTSRPREARRRITGLQSNAPNGGNAIGTTSLPDPDGSRLSPEEPDPWMEQVEETPRRRLQEGERRRCPTQTGLGFLFHSTTGK
jgi:hypothetical protein